MRRLPFIALTGLAFVAAAAAARAQGPAPQPNPKLKDRPPVRVAVQLPDLVVQQANLGKSSDGQTQSVRVTVANTCDAEAPQSYVTATFYDKPGGKTLFVVGHEVKALKGGETFSQVLELGDKKMPADANVAVEVDPYKKVKEDDETNNWMKLNPNEAPFPSNGATHCKPKY
jgi:CARDB